MLSCASFLKKLPGQETVQVHHRLDSNQSPDYIENVQLHHGLDSNENSDYTALSLLFKKKKEMYSFRFKFFQIFNVHQKIYKREMNCVVI